MDHNSKSNKNNPRKKTLVLFISLLAILACGIFPGGDDTNLDNQIIPLIQDETSTVEIEGGGGASETTSGLRIVLSEGQALYQEVEPLSIATGDPLSETEINAILARLPDMVSAPEEQVDFKLPEDLLPPPRTGDTIDEVFPPPPEDLTGVQPDYGSLEVLRFSPEGEIPIAPFVNVTFNQPMVRLTTIDELAADEIPVIIEPSLNGTWRWLGTKTLNFQYDSALIDRMPMATSYKVTIPAGTESAVGGELAQPVEFSFSTPPPTLQRYYPSYDPQPLDPIFFISFDQRVVPEAVLDTLQVTADGNTVDIKLATQDEIKGDIKVNRLVDNAGDNRWVVFRASKSLPPAAQINVTIGPGTPSAEGPLLTLSSQNYSFQTYEPLKVERHGCHWGDDECRPLVPFFIEFNNPIDPDKYDESLLHIEPELPGASVNIFGDTIQIRGATKGQTTYKVTLREDIQDIFGQTLGENVTLRFKVGKADPVLVGPQDIFVTLDPASKEPVLSLYTINYNKLDLKIYSVEPADWLEFKEYLREYQQTDKPLKPPGKLVLNETRRLETPTDVLTEVGIDLSEVMEGQFGHFIVVAKPPKGFFQEERYWETVQVWVQVTQIGLDAFADHSEMVVWTNALKDGTPLEGISIESDVGVELRKTGSNGVAQFEIPSDSTSYLVARSGKDAAFLTPSTHFWGDEGWYRRSVNDELRWYVFDDREMYRPGEEVHIKGWLRLIGGKQDGDVGLAGSALTGVNYRVIDPQGNDLGGDRTDVNSLGGFDFVFTIPENSNLGYASIELNAEGSLGNADGRWHGHSFQIQEFRTPEFEVTARNETTGPYFVGDSATVAVEAKYYAGGSLPNAEVTWWVNSSPSNYSPPNWPDFTFGFWQPWWWYYNEDFGQSTSETFNGVTDATGNHYLDLSFEESTGFRPFSVLAEATVMDVNRQAWSGATSLLVHPANLYIGLRSDTYFVERGTPLEIDLIVTDLDGEPIVDRQIHAVAARLEWAYNNGRWGEV
jgi:hypothetical protein